MLKKGMVIFAGNYSTQFLEIVDIKHSPMKARTRERDQLELVNVTYEADF